jgi:PIN domain nuclease of toxin-antitoxin system
MSLLLDTHTLLWFLLDDPRLSENAREHIVIQEESIFVSPASLWEIAINISLGKYALPIPFRVFWNEQLMIKIVFLSAQSVSAAATQNFSDTHLFTYNFN